MSSQPSPSDKKSELLPAEWSNNKDLYALRYESKDGSRKLLLKVVTVEKSVIINMLVSVRRGEVSWWRWAVGRPFDSHLTVCMESSTRLRSLYLVSLLLQLDPKARTRSTEKLCAQTFTTWYYKGAGDCPSQGNGYDKPFSDNMRGKSDCSPLWLL